MDKKDKLIRFVYILSIFIIPFLVAIKVVGINNDNLVSSNLLKGVDYSIAFLTILNLSRLTAVLPNVATPASTEQPNKA